MHENALFLSDMAPSVRQRRAAIAVAAVLLIAFLSVLLFKNRQLPHNSAYIPIVDSIMFLNDLITAALLYSQYSVGQSRARLALPMGYLFTSLIAVSHLLTFPGVFSSTGLLGANLQTPIWLYVFSRLGLSTAVIIYSLPNNAKKAAAAAPTNPAANVMVSIFAVAALVFTLTWLVAGNELLPSLMRDAVNATRLWNNIVAPAVVVANAAAMALLWRRRASMLDTWLLLALWAWQIELMLVSMTTSRFSVFWYASIFGVVASCFVLLILLYDATVLYARLASAAEQRDKEGERQRLMLRVVASSVAHEIRQPLAAIVANAQAIPPLLAETPPNFFEAHAALDDIISAGLRADDVISSIRGTLAGSEQPMASLNMGQIVTETLAFLRHDLDRGGVSVQLQEAPNLPLVRANKGQLMQVLANLITNAIEAMLNVENRPRVLSIRSAAWAPAFICVAVGDSGPGIAAEHATRIFDPFFTTKSRGTGLGLAICLQIIEDHGGRISALRGADQGSVFQILLPTAEA